MERTRENQKSTRRKLKTQPDPEYWLNKKQQALARYYKNKEAKINASLLVI